MPDSVHACQVHCDTLICMLLDWEALVTQGALVWNTKCVYCIAHVHFLQLLSMISKPPTYINVACVLLHTFTVAVIHLLVMLVMMSVLHV